MDALIIRNATQNYFIHYFTIKSASYESKYNLDFLGEAILGQQNVGIMKVWSTYILRINKWLKLKIDILISANLVLETFASELSFQSIIGINVITHGNPQTAI